MGKKSGSSGNRKAVEAQHKYDIAKWKFDWQQMQDAYEYKQDAFDVQVFNQEQKIDYQNQLATNEWADKEKIRIFDYNNQIAAYNSSVEAYETQLDYNNLAAEISSADITRSYNEKLTAIGFQNEELLMKHGFDIRAQTQDIQSKKAQASFQLEGAKLKNMAAKGQVANMGQQGRTARKNMQSALAGFGQQQAIILDVLENYSYNIQNYNK